MLQVISLLCPTFPSCSGWCAWGPALPFYFCSTSVQSVNLWRFADGGFFSSISIYKWKQFSWCFQMTHPASIKRTMTSVSILFPHEIRCYDCSSNLIERGKCGLVVRRLLSWSSSIATLRRVDGTKLQHGMGQWAAAAAALHFLLPPPNHVKLPNPFLSSVGLQSPKELRKDREKERGGGGGAGHSTQVLQLKNRGEVWLGNTTKARRSTRMGHVAVLFQSCLLLPLQQGCIFVPIWGKPCVSHG